MLSDESWEALHTREGRSWRTLHKLVGAGFGIPAPLRGKVWEALSRLEAQPGERALAERFPLLARPAPIAQTQKSPTAIRRPTLRSTLRAPHCHLWGVLRL